MLSFFFVFVLFQQKIDEINQFHKTTSGSGGRDGVDDFGPTIPSPKGVGIATPSFFSPFTGDVAEFVDRRSSS